MLEVESPRKPSFPVAGVGEALSKHVDRLLLARYSPPGVVVNQNLDVLLFRGQTGAYLQAAPGQPQNNLISMARGGLSSALRATVEQAKESAIVARSPNIEIDEEDGETRVCDVVVIPVSGLPDAGDPLFLILFEQPGRGVIDRLANDELRARNQEMTLVDIDALKHLVATAEVARAQAEDARNESDRANSAKDDFLATLSHELRTPLSSMLLNAQLLSSGDLVEPADLKRAGEALERATRMQAKLIDDLLDVSRIVAGKLTLEPQAVDLGSVIRASLDSVGPLINVKQLTLKLAIEPMLGEIWADRVRVQQVVSNLLTNAIKFTPRGGQVAITVDSEPGVARLRVTDTGIGIEADFLPHVFARFSQSDTSITRKYGGLGLGLALVRHLVEMQGGTVRAESEGAGRGATFSVTFPFAPVAVEASDVDESSVHALDRPGRTKRYDRLTGLRVLVIDDDLRTREAVQEVLELAGVVIELAASAAEGLAAVDTFKPQVILCDVAMPGEDGYTFIRKLRAREGAQGPSIPALALTALATAEDRGRAVRAGFQLHIAKPIDIDRLRDAVLTLSTLLTEAS